MPVARACALLASLLACCATAGESPQAKFIRHEIVATHPHDVGTFTQGLAWHDGGLVESSGQYGRSALVRRAVSSDAALSRRPLDKTQFGEGVAGDGARFVQLTWRSGIALVYDRALRPIGRYAYDGEGWGLAYDGRRWLMSDGSSRIVARHRETFAPQGGFDVTDRGRRVTRLNELEFARGRLYANVWNTDLVAVIDPADGEVEAWIDLARLRRGFVKPETWNESQHVLNGIAFNPATGNFFVTGKCWPVLFEIRLLEPGA